MKKSNSRKGMLLAIIGLSIGFAAVSTTLVINGTIKLGSNADDFEENLIFTAAEVSYSDTNKESVSTGLISADGKTITFETEELSTIGETATLTYEITNNSQYDADLHELECTVTNKAGTDVTAAVMTAKTGDYIKVEASSVAGQLAANGAKKSDNTIVATMIKSYAEQTATSYTITCEIDADAVASN